MADSSGAVWRSPREFTALDSEARVLSTVRTVSQSTGLQAEKWRKGALDRGTA